MLVGGPSSVLSYLLISMHMEAAEHVAIGMLRGEQVLGRFI